MNVRSARRAPAFPTAAAVICTMACLAVSHALAQGETGQITLSGTAIDTADDNRFFTRIGGSVRDDVTYDGLVPGQTYTLAAQLHNMTAGAPEGDVVVLPFTPDAPAGKVSIELPVPQNRTPFNIDHVVTLKLYEGRLEAPGEARSLAELADLSNAGQTIQVHAVQSISVTATDAADGDRALPPEGGTIAATVEHVNLVPGYHYTLWGQLLTPSGQSTGIFASIPDHVPDQMNGSVRMEFAVPPGRDGIRLIPAIGLYHRNRVSIDDKGALTWLPDAPHPVMIASDPGLDDPEQTVNIGIPFEEQTAGGQ